MKKLLITVSVLFSFAFVFAQFTDIRVIKETKSKNKSVVVSAHPLASEAGILMIEEGGNAFDATIATQFALAVVFPYAGNIGGGGFMVATRANGEKLSLDFRETAPEKSHRDMYLDKNGNALSELSEFGALASGTPGSVSGIYEMHKYAKIPMKRLIQPAIDLAEKGFAITLGEANFLNSQKENFLKYNGDKPIAFVKDSPWKEGDILVQKELAETLKRIQLKGLKGFYEGKTADLIVAEMKRSGGIISKKDLRTYKAKFRKPLTFSYKGNEIVSMPLPSSGGIMLAQMLTMSNFGGLENMQHLSPEAIQLMIEAERRAFADRAEYMGDPDFSEDKTSMLISENYLRERFANYNPSLATPSAEVGKIVNPIVEESNDTTHISVLDTEGNAVSVTTTIGGLYGNKVVVKGAGFFLNNEMGGFSIKPGVPNSFGAVGGEVNAIVPGKRMLSSMCPTIVLKNGKPYIIVGTPGGTTIPTSIFQAITGVIDFGTGPRVAINAPKFHHQWLPETVLVEKTFPKYIMRELEKKNYEFKIRTDFNGFIGRTEIIVVNPESGEAHAVADHRGDDSVALSK